MQITFDILVKTVVFNNNQRYLVRVTLNSKADKPVALISRSN